MGPLTDQLLLAGFGPMVSFDPGMSVLDPRHRGTVSIAVADGCSVRAWLLRRQPRKGIDPYTATKWNVPPASGLPLPFPTTVKLPPLTFGLSFA